MAGEPNQVKWVGIRPTNPAEDIPVTLDGEKISIGLPAGAVRIIEDRRQEDSTGVIYTVTAGKTLYLITAYLSVLNMGVTYGLGRVVIYDAAPANIGYVLEAYCGMQDTVALSLSFNPPLVLPSLYSVRLSSNLEYLRASGGFTGYEV